jgi:hypothetical protein
VGTTGERVTYATLAAGQADDFARHDVFPGPPIHQRAYGGGGPAADRTMEVR